MNCLALIAGTGFENAFAESVETETVATPYGSVDLCRVSLQQHELIVLPRHGRGHSVPPHEINYTAQMWALKELGIEDIMATATTGSLRSDRVPGSILILDDFIDFRGQVTTFFQGSNSLVKHTDFSDPFSTRVRNALSNSALVLSESNGGPVKVYNEGTYVCTLGPRYETPAEVRLFRQWGADVVGMTVAPEAILAKELGMNYAAAAVVTNLGTGLSKNKLDHEEVSRQMSDVRNFLVSLFKQAAMLLLEPPDGLMQVSK